MRRNIGFYYEGKYYAVGTRVKAYNILKSHRIEEATVIKVDDFVTGIRFDCGDTRWFSHIKNSEEIIVDIINPVRGRPCKQIYMPRKRNYPSSDAIFYGWFFYIFIMIFVSFWYGRIWLWILISLIFYLWKNGYASNKEDK